MLSTVSAQALGSAAIIAPTAVAPLITASLAVPPESIGLYVSAVYLSAMITSIASGPSVIGLGGTRVAQICLLLSAVGLWLVGAQWLALAVLGAILIGAGYGPLTPASADVLMRVVPSHRLSLAYSVKQSGTPLGGVLVGALMPGLALAVGWSAALAILGATCAAFAAFNAVVRRRLDGVRSGAIPAPGLGTLVGPVQYILRDRRLRTLAVASFVFSATNVSLTAYLVTFLTTGLGWSLVLAGLVLAVAQATGTFGRIFWGWLADTPVGAKSTLLVLSVSMAASSLAVLALDRDTSQWSVFVLMGAYGMTAVGWGGVFIATVARVSPSGRAAFVTGGALGFTFLGVVAGPPVFGIIAALADSYQVAFAALALPLAVCCVLIWRLPRIHAGTDTDAA